MDHITDPTGSEPLAATAEARSAHMDDLVRADDARYAALLAGDAEALSSTLAEDFAYLHSSGRSEGKESFVQSIDTRRIVYREVDVRERFSWFRGDVGVLRGHVVLDLAIESVPRRLDVLFLAVWHVKANRWMLSHWASVPRQPPPVLSEAAR